MLKGGSCKFCPLLHSNKDELSYQLIVEAIMQIALSLSSKQTSGLYVYLLMICLPFCYLNFFV